MPEVSSDVITHKLSVDSTCYLVKQKERNFALDRSWAIDKEVTKLLEAIFIREVNYPNLLANVVLVKKANGK